MQIATINNLSSTNPLFFADINNDQYNLAASSSMTIPASLISFANVYSALSNGTMTITGWTLPDVITYKDRLPTRVQIIENTAAGWTASGTVLAVGQIGLETDTFNVKIGDSRTTWTSLGYYSLGYFGLFPFGNNAYSLKSLTTGTTVTTMTTDGLAAGVNNQVVLPNNTAVGFTGKVIASDTLTGNASFWTLAGTIKRGANAAATSMIAAVTPTLVSQSSGASTWAITCTADATNGALKITFAGSASTNVICSAKIDYLFNIG